MKKVLTPLALALLCAAAPAAAYDRHLVGDETGRPIFDVRFYDPEDGPFVEGESEAGEEPFKRVSAWAWNAQQKETVLHGVSYLAQMLQLPGEHQGPVVLNVGTDDAQDNASGLSQGIEDDTRTAMQRHFQGLPIDPDQLISESHGHFILGKGDFLSRYPATQIPLSDHFDLFSVAVHEVAHGLGIATSDEKIDDQADTPAFDEDGITGWTLLMVDDHGRPARPGQRILCDFCKSPYDPEAFDARADRALVVGPHIAEVLEGALPGVPVSMYSYPGGQRRYDEDVMSHSELKNSMMSHQLYRNYQNLLEAELAVLQDLGYTLDRRNFFGRSVYGSGLDIVNDRGFGARNAQGTAYLPGQYNRSMLGLGLHVYGSHNRIRQVADLLAEGEGGTGVRVDGEGNTLIIDPGVRVHGNGPGGHGVMFTYGRNHTLVQRGDVEALGFQGVGLRFDFGNNALTNKTEYRGSYIHTIQGQSYDYLPELRGSLVTTADITGRVAGSEAAIHISRNAHVGSINLMQGARIEGDIVSHYAERDEAGALRLTQVSFGQKADDQGRATGQSDAAFRMAYGGQIRGRDNLVLAFDGGQTHLTGQHQVNGVAVRPAATLSGTSTFELAEGGVFLNEGTVSPGNSIGTMSVVGDYRQAPSGRLQMEFNAAGEHDVLAVSGAVDLAGTLELVPHEGWYDNAWSLNTGASMLPNGGQVGSFDTVSFVPASPTVDFAARSQGGTGYLLTASRAPDAYSRHATNENARATGRALEGVFNALPADAQPFMRAMDFSAPDGSDVARALDQASPQGYSAGLAASLMRERDVMDTVLRGFGDGLRHAQGADWKGFAVAFGGEGRQDTRDSMAGYDATTYGLVIGGGRRLASHPDIAVGVHLDIAEQSVKLKSPLWGKGDTTAFGLGAQVQYQPNPLAGPHAHGAFRVGVEHGSMDRKVGVRDYYAAHSADWTGHSASVQVGGGYRWSLSPTVSAGPLLALNYARVSRPGIEESGPAATRLALESRHIDALRSSLGVGAVLRHALDDGGELSAHAEISWDHEWLDRDVVQAASFAAVPGSAFQSRNAVLPRNSLGLRAGVAWQRSERFSVGAGLGGRLGSGYKSVEGQLNLRWAF